MASYERDLLAYEVLVSAGRHSTLNHVKRRCFWYRMGTQGWPGDISTARRPATLAEPKVTSICQW